MVSAKIHSEMKQKHEEEQNKSTSLQENLNQLNIKVQSLTKERDQALKDH